MPVALPEEVGLDLSQLETISAELEKSDEHKIHSLLVMREGRLAFEAYYNGNSRESPHDIRSATKSITSLLTGIAVDQGLIGGVDDPVRQYLGEEYQSPTLGHDMLLRHLLTMSNGMDCDDGDMSTRGQEDRMYRSKDWVEYFVTLERAHDPGSISRYCTGGVVALGEIVSTAAGKDFADFADDVLFEPLGIHNYRWSRFDDGRKVDTGGHLYLTSQGLAKIGQLVLQNGEWEGRQLVSAEWLEQSTRTYTQLDGNPYGFLWWLDKVRYGDEEIQLVRASGNGGQAIVVVPEHDLVVVATGGYYNSDEVRVIYELLYNVILPSVPEIGEVYRQMRGR